MSVRGIHLYAPFGDALYAFKSRGFGGEIGLGTPTIDPGLDASREIMD